MGNCPNPHCDGNVITIIDFDEYGCSIRCDTCPFYIPITDEIENKMGDLLKEAEEEAFRWALERMSDIDWDAWEKKEFEVMKTHYDSFGKPGIHYGPPRGWNREYWESRGVVFERVEHGS